MSKAPLFLTNDQNEKNSYGFHVDTTGIDLKTRFEGNPICLNNHSNDTKDVLGTWIDIEVKEGKLFMRPSFDTEDTAGKEVVRKVLAGTLKGCSLGIMFDPKDMVNENGKIVLKKCILFEVSIVAVPSNGNAIALFNMNQEPITEQEIKSLCLSLKTAKPFNNDKTMKLITTHLQLAEGSTEEAVLLAIKAVEKQLSDSKTEYATLKTKFDALETANKDRNTAELTAELEAAVKDGRIDDAGKTPILELSHESAMKLLKSLPKRKSLKDQLQDEEEASAESKYGKLSWAELDKGNHLAKLKADFPDYYAERFELQYGRKPNN
ncbi:phage prohead protease, HK97 family [Soonwooa buanensis]|uniref:Phage prohead protease, HK97 family n=1 Tax=Soonwooa buanensis TaxID=619805 RepID=A0A1T5CW64_9FLAO|nr:HK97 family phage prohead protease [Soonwooa buanensis]SKB63672.1 phage prohead protease, HK97 family [Soonwooa buanensis]